LRAEPVSPLQSWAPPAGISMRVTSAGTSSEPSTSKLDGIRSRSADLEMKTRAMIELPSQDHLGCADPVGRRCLRQHRGAQPAAAEGAATLGGHAALLRAPERPGIVQGRTQGDLVDSRGDAGGLDELVDLLGASVAHAHRTGRVLLGHGDQRLPGGGARLAVGWPVHEPELDSVCAQRGEAGPGRLALACGVLRRALRVREDRVPGRCRAARRRSRPRCLIRWMSRRGSGRSRGSPRWLAETSHAMLARGTPAVAAGDANTPRSCGLDGPLVRSVPRGDFCTVRRRSVARRRRTALGLGRGARLAARA